MPLLIIWVETVFPYQHYRTIKVFYALKYWKYYIANSLAYLKIYDKEQQRKFILLKSISWPILLSFRNKRYKLQIKNIIEPYQTNINTRKRMKYWCLAFRHMSKDYMNFNLFVRNKLLQWLRQSLLQADTLIC